MGYGINYMALDLNIVEHKLDNGLKILFSNYTGSPSATFMAWYKVGARNEEAGKTGISHFLEHMSFKKTELFDRGQIVAEITKNGGAFNAYTSRDFTSYYESFASGKLELAMIIESQRMNKLVFDNDAREKEIGVILSELEKNLDNPYSNIENALREKAYISHPYRNPVIGHEEDIKSISTEDLKSYYNRFYLPNNATIAVVGNFDRVKALELIKRHFGNIEPAESASDISHDPPQNEIKRVKLYKRGVSPIVKIGFHTPPASESDIYALNVLSEMLNLGVSSRMNQSLVETEIATDVSVSMEIAKDPGLFTVTATLYPKVSHKKAEETIFEEIEGINNHNAPDADELERTKRRILSSFEFNRDGSLKLAYLLGYYDAVDSYKFIDNYLDKISKVSLDEIKSVAKKYLKPSNATIADFIPSENHTKRTYGVYDYVPNETINHIYSPPPVIIDEKIGASPVMFEKKALDNGLRVLFSQNKISDTIKLFGTVNAGNILAATVNPVLPSVCGGMLNRGSKNRSKMDIASEIEARGASVGISNVGESVNFSLSCTSQDFPYVLETLSDILMRPDFPEDEFIKYMHFALSGIRQKKDNLGYLARLAFSREVYPKNHIFYNYSLKTQEKQLKSITREDVMEFYNRYYAPNGLIMGIAGNMEAEQVFGLVEKYFGDWKYKEVQLPKPREASLQKKYVEKTVQVAGKSEAEVLFGHYGNLKRQDADFHRANVMNFIFGGSGALSSRIGLRIREDLGLVYSISSGFTALLVPGSWSVRFGVDCKYADVALEALKEELNRFVEHGATENELELAKSCLIGSYPLRFANNSGIARALLINEFYELGDDYLNIYPDIIKSITLDEVNQAAQKYLHPESATVIKAGDFNSLKY